MPLIYWHQTDESAGSLFGVPEEDFLWSQQLSNVARACVSTVLATTLLVAVGVVTHTTLLVITTVILPAVVPGSVYVEPVSPGISTPAFFH